MMLLGHAGHVLCGNRRGVARGRDTKVVVWPRSIACARSRFLRIFFQSIAQVDDLREAKGRKWSWMSQFTVGDAAAQGLIYTDYP